MTRPKETIVKLSQQEVLPESGIQILQPAGWAAPKGYSNGIAARGRTVVIGGQIRKRGLEVYTGW